MTGYQRAKGAMRVYSNAFAHPRRIMKFNSGWAAPRLGEYFAKANAIDIDGCLLRYLLAPTRRLSAALEAAVGAGAGDLSGRQLVEAVSAHVRMGDSVFKNAQVKWAMAGE